MTAETLAHSTKIIAALGLYPPSVQEGIISDPLFRDKHGLVFDSLVTFPNISSFQQSCLLRAVRQAFSEVGKRLSVEDHNGESWELTAENRDGDLCIRLSSREGKDFLLDVFWSLFSDVEERLSRLDRESQRLNLPNDRKNYWRQVLMQDVVSDNEMVELQADLAKTPTSVSEQLVREMAEGKSTMTSLVPQSLLYYERLVGRYVSSGDIVEYARNEADTFIRELFSADHHSGLISALLLTSHPSIPHTLEPIGYDADALEGLFSWLVTDGDLFSRVGAIELGLSLLDKHPFLVNQIENLVRQLLEDQSEEPYRLLSALIILVDGEVARLQIFKDLPPFYRRLASIAQASLIARCINAADIDANHFREWAIAQRSMPFYCQTFIDLRLEPRWQPNYIAHEQLRGSSLFRVGNGMKADFHNPGV